MSQLSTFETNLIESRTAAIEISPVFSIAVICSLWGIVAERHNSDALLRSDNLLSGQKPYNYTFGHIEVDGTDPKKS
jgi:hypothetical protein